MLLMDRLPCDAKRLGNLREGPARGQGVLDSSILHSVSEATERADGGESISRIIRESGRSGSHMSTIVDSSEGCQPKLATAFAFRGACEELAARPDRQAATA